MQGAAEHDNDREEAQRPLVEAGEGESEGFEEAERELIEHATHGDQHGTGRILFDAPDADDEAVEAEYGEPDHERSSERDDEQS